MNLKWNMENHELEGKLMKIIRSKDRENKY